MDSENSENTSKISGRPITLNCVECEKPGAANGFIGEFDRSDKVDILVNRIANERNWPSAECVAYKVGCFWRLKVVSQRSGFFGQLVRPIPINQAVERPLQQLDLKSTDQVIKLLIWPPIKNYFPPGSPHNDTDVHVVFLRRNRE